MQWYMHSPKIERHTEWLQEILLVQSAVSLLLVLQNRGHLKDATGVRPTEWELGDILLVVW